jgi:hypothetical protein
MRRVDSDTSFYDHTTAFQHPVLVPDRLQEILDDFGDQILTATFAIRNGLVEGVWIDPHHNYIATVFSKATGDDDDFVMINSIGGGTDTCAESGASAGTQCAEGVRQK